MAKRNPSNIPRPSSIRFLTNLSTISRSPTPSTALLTLLASLVGSVNSFPVACQDSNDPPPSFLCPSLEPPHPQFDVQELVLPPQTPPPSFPVPGPSRIIRTDPPTPTVKRRIRRSLAPGYTQGDDGLWRKLSTWSLYGSTVCVCHDTSTLTGDRPVGDLATTPPSSTNGTEFLPPGWSRPSETSTVRTTLILSLSLVLAAAIVAFIILFLLWRRKRRYGLRKDLEKKLVKRRGSPQSVDSERDHRTQSKLWTRATTRWRENVERSARRRRNVRLSATSLHASNNSVVSLSHTVLSAPSSPRPRSPSLPPSRVPSPTPTLSTVRSVRSSLSRTDHAPQNINIEPSSPSPPSPPPLPPAYQGSSHLSPYISPVKDPSHPSPASSFYHLHPAQADFLPSGSPSPSSLESDTTTPSNLHVAHVAIDDKAVLRQMEALSSRPPTESESSDAHSSAPVLYEDDVQSLEYEDAPELGPSPAGFPQPPAAAPSSSKGKAAALEYYDYDDLNVEPDSQPSAPPFEAENPILPSAPPQDEAQPLPSAPPEMVDPSDDPTTLGDGDLPRQMGGGDSADDAGPDSSRPEPLPRYRP